MQKNKVQRQVGLTGAQAPSTGPSCAFELNSKLLSSLYEINNLNDLIGGEGGTL